MHTPSLSFPYSSSVRLCKIHNGFKGQDGLYQL